MGKPLPKPASTGLWGGVPLVNPKAIHPLTTTRQDPPRGFLSLDVIFKKLNNNNYYVILKN